ncbi:MAG: hypothetical protein R3B93_28805 [Bacteroidia bacterium]
MEEWNHIRSLIEDFESLERNDSIDSERQFYADKLNLIKKLIISYLGSSLFKMTNDIGDLNDFKQIFHYFESEIKLLKKQDREYSLEDYMYIIKGDMNPLYQKYLSSWMSTILKKIKKDFDLAENLLDLQSFQYGPNEIEKYLDVDLELRTPIQQYLLFFKTFVRDSKGETINVDVSETINGLKIKIRFSDGLSVADIKEWLYEYVSFTTQDGVKEIRVTEKTKGDSGLIDRLILKLENEIRHLEESLRVSISENHSLKKDKKYFKKLVKKFAEREKTFVYQADRGENHYKKLNQIDKETVLNAIQEGKIGDAFKLVRAMAFESEIKKDLFLFEAQYRSLLKDMDLGEITFENAQITKNRITQGVVRILSNI